MTGIAALHVACDQGRLLIAAELLAAGASVNLDTHDQINALYFAMKARHADLVDLLIASGADVNLPVQDGSVVTRCVHFTAGRRTGCVQHWLHFA